MHPSLLLPVELIVRGGAATLLLCLAEAVPFFHARPGWRRLWWIAAAVAFLLPLSLLHSLPAPLLFVLLIWAMGTAFFLLRLAGQTWLTARRWNRRRLVTEGPLPALLEDCKARTGVTAPIGLVLAPDAELSSPALLGWLRPRILLPSSLVETLTREELEAVLLHELIHFRSLDIPGDWLFTLARAFQWFNPCAHLAYRRWRIAREEAADAATLALLAEKETDAPRFYGDLLLRLIKRQNETPFHPHGALAIAESHATLKQRLHMIVTPASHTSRRALPCVLLTLLLASVLTATVAVKPVSAETATAPDPKVEAIKKEARAAIELWLKKNDAGDDAGAWEDGSALFKKGVTKEKWVRVSQNVHTTLGSTLSRQFVSLAYQSGPLNIDEKDPLPNPAVQAKYQTTFQNIGAATETVSFIEENDGKWRAAGYLIKPKE